MVEKKKSGGSTKLITYSSKDELNPIEEEEIERETMEEPLAKKSIKEKDIELNPIERKSKVAPPFKQEWKVYVQKVRDKIAGYQVRKGRQYYKFYTTKKEAEDKAKELNEIDSRQNRK